MNNNKFEIIIPKENANDETVRILEWNFKDGEKVKLGDKLLEIETSKAAINFLIIMDFFK